MKNIVILGSTGSIGRSTLSVVAEHRDKFRIVGLTAQRNHTLLLQQIKEFRPALVAVADTETAAIVRKSLAHMPEAPKLLEGPSGVVEVAAAQGVDFVLSAIVGAAGLGPTMAAVKLGRTIGLANKETLVVAGQAVKAEADKSGSLILPVDSEHSAIFQCLLGKVTSGEKGGVRRIILTASGGPFIGRSKEQLEAIRPEDALKHPSWTMGRKITIDSATLMNKGLEVIEAHHLFDMPTEMIDVVVHPQSIVHSMVEFIDGSVIGQMSVPDMRGAIAYALSYPERLPGVIPPLDLAALGQLTFDRPDMETFPCLAYAYEALAEGGTMPAVLNAANEVAVEGFLEGRIGFNQIPAIIKSTMSAHINKGATGLTDVIAAHEWAEAAAREMVAKSSK